MAAPHVPDSRKRPRASHGPSAECFCVELENGVRSSCNKCRGPENNHHDNHEVSASSSSSSCVQPGYISSASPTAKKQRAHHHSPRSYASSPRLDWEWGNAAAFADTADSATGSSLPSCVTGRECSQELPCRISSDEEAESCCGVEDTSEVDVACFLLHDVWKDGDNEGGEALSFNPETIFLNDGTSTDCSEDAAFTGCSAAENGNWFLNDFGSQGHAFLNEVLDQEWMAAAVANLDRLNDTLDTDSCVLHLLESDHVGEDY